MAAWVVIKTQIRLPDALYLEAKLAAAEYEMSFAEFVRRSLEDALAHYPPREEPWFPPEPVGLGIRFIIGDGEPGELDKQPDEKPRRRRKPRKSGKAGK